MWEQADTFCRKTWTGLAHFLHLKVRVRAGLAGMAMRAESESRNDTSNGHLKWQSVSCRAQAPKRSEFPGARAGQRIGRITCLRVTRPDVVPAGDLQTGRGDHGQQFIA
jgi:hypothetical protein